MKARDIRGLDIGMLRTFDALMRERSVSRAAARLFVTQPAVSASLNRLREVFGEPLFTRTPHGVAPTHLALLLAPQVEKVLADIAGLLLQEATFDPASSDRIFRIAGSDHASRLFLAPLSRVLCAMGSSVRLVWEPAGTSSIAERLHQGELDLALVARLEPPHDMETQVLYEDHHVFVLRRGHPQAAQPVTLASFCAIPQVFLGYGVSTLDDLIDEALKRAGLRRRAHIVVSSFDQIVHHLRHSDHGAVIARRVALSYGDDLQISPLPFDLVPYQALMCWARRCESDPAIRWLRERIRELVPPEPGMR